MNTATQVFGRTAGSKLNIRARLVLGFAAVCAISAGTVVAIMWSMGGVEARIARIAHLRVPTTISSARMANDLNASVAALRGWMLTGDSSFKAERAAIWRDIDAVRADLDRLSAQWTTPDTVARWTTFKATLDEFRAAQRRVEALAHGAEERPAAPIFLTETMPRADRLLESLSGPKATDGSRSGGMVASHRLFLADETHAAEELRRQSTVLGLLYRIAAIANEADVPEHVMATAVHYICVAMGWQVGHIYVPRDTSPDVLVSSKLWYLQDPERFAGFRKISENLECHRGVGLLGRVLAGGEPASIVDVTKDEDFLRAKAAEDCGLRTGIAMPVFVGREVVAVLEFFCQRVLQTDPPLLEVLVNIGTLLGRVFERKRAETALTAQERALRKRVTELRDTRRQLEKKNRELGAHRDRYSGEVTP